MPLPRTSLPGCRRWVMLITCVVETWVVVTLMLGGFASVFGRRELVDPHMIGWLLGMSPLFTTLFVVDFRVFLKSLGRCDSSFSFIA